MPSKKSLFVAIILSFFLTTYLYGNPFIILYLPTYIFASIARSGALAIIFCIIISVWLASYIYKPKRLKQNFFMPSFVSVFIIIFSYLLFWGVSSVFISFNLAKIKPDERISTSHYSYLHRVPTRRVVYDRPSRVIILKDCDILRWSYWSMSFQSIKPNTAAVIAPLEWRKSCNWPLYSYGNRN